MHFTECLGQEFGEFFVAHVFDLLNRYRFSVGDVNLAGGKQFFMPGPTFEGTIDDNRDNGGCPSSGQKAEAGFEWGDFSIVGTGAFWEESDAAAFIELVEDLSHSKYVRLAKFYRYSVD